VVRLVQGAGVAGGWVGWWVGWWSSGARRCYVVVINRRTRGPRGRAKRMNVGKSFCEMRLRGCRQEKTVEVFSEYQAAEHWRGGRRRDMVGVEGIGTIPANTR